MPRVNLAWSAPDEAFDSFLVELTSPSGVTHSQNLTLSGDAFSLGISGLNPNNSYLVGLYGMYQGSFLEPVYSEATTGTCNLSVADFCQKLTPFPCLSHGDSVTISFHPINPHSVCN
uniref:Fibronectin type-III domain-containing protein n=1 Tax=Scophthalmus maximus TaxID=52904 RepID=A0A8D3DEE9_SCOMX